MGSLRGYMPPILSLPRLLHRNGRPRKLITLLSYVSVVSLLLPLQTKCEADLSPHQPQLLTWQVVSQTNDVIWSTSTIAPPGTWWPDLTPDLCTLVAAGLPDWEIQREELQQLFFYVCPKEELIIKDGSCGKIKDYYCAKGGCETTGTVPWIPWAIRRMDRIQVARSTIPPGASRPSLCQLSNSWKGTYCRDFPCNPLNITFTLNGKHGASRLPEERMKWVKGRTWGLRFHMSGRDKGLIFSIRLKISPPPTEFIGPNLITHAPPNIHEPTSKQVSSPAPRIETIPPRSNQPSTQANLLKIMDKAFAALNATNPEATKSCWLCYDIAPPYYEAVAWNLSQQVLITNPVTPVGTSPKPTGLTLTMVSGKGLCLGSVPITHHHLCANQARIPNKGYITAPTDGWWACGSGLTPILSLEVLNLTSDYCVLVRVYPRIIYHPDYDFLNALQETRIKREPISITLAVLLGLGVAAGIGTGVAAITTQDSKMSELQSLVAEDIRALEDSISKLQESLTSLSEIALQNRRGLDLVFLQQGGLCAALKEECCFYIDHSGVVKDTMKKLRERLDQRRWEHRDKQGWFESWFNQSPWLTTLISTLMGPLLILLLLLIIGPCIFNRLIAFIRERISAVQVLVLRQQYQWVNSQDEEVEIP